LEYALSHYRLDIVCLVVVTLLSIACINVRLRRRGVAQVRSAMFGCAVFATLAASALVAELTAAEQEASLTRMVSGMAPTYAAEFTRLGHARVSTNTDPNDPTYLTLIEAQKQWLQLNPTINDIYTYRLVGDSAEFVVDSETDYDHNGLFDQPREQRTTPGESYADGVALALDVQAENKAVFDAVPYTDRWGTWVSALAPLYNDAGHIEAFLGIDLDARQWTSSIERARLLPIAAGMVVLSVLIGSHLMVRITRDELRQRKQAESERDALHQQLLEQGVQTRTAELEQARRGDMIKMDELEKVVELRTAELRRQAMHDRLTGLANRSRLSDTLETAVNRVKRERCGGYAVLFLDFDHFKVINDSLGHHAGDQLLVTVAGRLEAAAQSYAKQTGHAVLAARLGGDEFVVLVQSDTTSNPDVMQFAQRIITDIAQPCDIGDRRVQTGVSIGITSSALSYNSSADVLRDADTAMYIAKKNKGCYAVFDAAMHHQAMARMTLGSDLHQAIERDELRAQYQPIYCLNTGVIKSFEALCRWQHHELGNVPPDRFVALAEETGFINPLGKWMLERTCAQLNRFHDLFGNKMPSISVNISRLQLADHDAAVDMVRTALSRARFEPSRLVLEITESALGSDPEAGIRTLEAIRALGVRLFLDDFGVAYSSLSMLPDLPLHGLKIDRQFVKLAEKSRGNTALIHAITQLAMNLNLVVVAEGVETLNQVAMLQALDCGLAQGYFFSRAIDADEAERLLSQRGPQTWTLNVASSTLAA